ncbi:MAG TPA: TRAP transporter substrate-binding protein DctP [Bacteroidota bacterium]
MKTLTRFTLLLALLPVLAGPAKAQQYTIKFATLATEGTTWLNVLHQYDQAVRQESGGRLGFKIYAGGVQGEDKDVMRKIRLGQLQSAGVTGVGVGEISTRLRILDAPFLFQNYDDVDHLHQVMDPDFQTEFQKNDFVLLGWAEVGFVYIFTNTPVRTVADMNGVKMWMWEGDAVAEAAFRALGINPIPLSVVDVLTSLQTGLINGAYTSPLAALALQWNTRVKYMMSVPLADAAGAVVISKKAYDKLPPDLQEILTRNGRKYMADLTAKSRQENANAVQTMKKNGLQIIDVTSPKTIEEFQAVGKKARQSLVGRLFDQAWLDRAEKIVADYRASRGSGK